MLEFVTQGCLMGSNVVLSRVIRQQMIRQQIKKGNRLRATKATVVFSSVAMKKSGHIGISNKSNRATDIKKDIYLENLEDKKTLYPPKCA